ncbi:MAG: tRNA pseudouridine(38-40) synthase TruA [Candidatus Latescibacteria bacterium]|nr:tRNA pseudouridine(38-40) synthase TruA [Candidatus Latescibacterota bacterium]
MNIKLEIEYDGTNYAGWQYQPNKITIQGEIEKALAQLLQKKLRITGASRTDAGVSALGQVANFEVTPLKGLSLAKLQCGLNSILPKDIWIRKISKAADEFNSRRYSKSKIYRYRIIANPSPIRQKFAWFVRYELDINKMRRAVKLFIRHNDFSLFCAAKDKNGEVDIESIIISQKRDQIDITIKANRFLYKMVRRIVGALVEIGRGHRSLDDIKKALAGEKHRSLICAPAHGLILKKVKY